MSLGHKHTMPLIHTYNVHTYIHYTRYTLKYAEYGLNIYFQEKEWVYKVFRFFAT